MNEAYQLGDLVAPLIGPHKGAQHRIIHKHEDGSYNIAPTTLKGSQIRYHLGAARAQPHHLEKWDSTSYLHGTVGGHPKRATPFQDAAVTGNPRHFAKEEAELDEAKYSFRSQPAMSHWLTDFEKTVVNKDERHRGKIDWDTAKHLYNSGHSTEKAAQKYVDSIHKEEAELDEARMPLKDHPYHSKTDAELRYIIKDAGSAAIAMKGHNSKAEAKYLDQVNDASTVLHHRKTKSEEVELDEGNVPNAFKKDLDAYKAKQRTNKVGISVTRPIGTKIADIGPGRKEMNVKTDSTWNKLKHTDEDREIERKSNQVDGMNEATKTPHQEMHKKLGFPKSTDRYDRNTEHESHWTKKGGHAGKNMILRVINKAKDLGFEHQDTSHSNSPDGGHIGHGMEFVHPNGHVLHTSSSYGVTARDNRYTMHLSHKPTSESVSVTPTDVASSSGLKSFSQFMVSEDKEPVDKIDAAYRFQMHSQEESRYANQPRTVENKRHLEHHRRMKAKYAKHLSSVEEALAEGKMGEIASDIEDHLGKHVDEYKKHGGAEALASRTSRTASHIAKLHKIKPEHATKFVNDWVSSRISESTENLAEAEADVSDATINSLITKHGKKHRLYTQGKETVHGLGVKELKQRLKIGASGSTHKKFVQHMMKQGFKSTWSPDTNEWIYHNKK